MLIRKMITKNKTNIFDTYGFNLANIEIFDDGACYATYYTLDTDKNIVDDSYETQYLQFQLKDKKSIKGIKNLDIVSAIKYLIAQWGDDYDSIYELMDKMPSCFYENSKIFKFITQSLPDNAKLRTRVNELSHLKQKQIQSYRRRMNLRNQTLSF